MTDIDTGTPPDLSVPVSPHASHSHNYSLSLFSASIAIRARCPCSLTMSMSVSAVRRHSHFLKFTPRARCDAPAPSPPRIPTPRITSYALDIGLIFIICRMSAIQINQLVHKARASRRRSDDHSLFTLSNHQRRSSLLVSILGLILHIALTSAQDLFCAAKNTSLPSSATFVMIGPLCALVGILDLDQIIESSARVVLH